MQAIKDYENNKWKVIGQKVGKPAKVRKHVFSLMSLPCFSFGLLLWPQSHHAAATVSPSFSIHLDFSLRHHLRLVLNRRPDPCRLGVSARETRHQLLLIRHVGKPSLQPSSVCLPTRPSPTRPTLRTSSCTSARLRDTEYLDHALPAPCILNLTARRSLPRHATIITRATSSLELTESCVDTHT
jgi:hypothetical protein